MTGARIDRLRAELRDDTAFVATPAPRLSWTVVADGPGWLQASAELTDGSQTVTLATPDSVLVDWPFAPLAPGEGRDVAVRARSTDGRATPWSVARRVEAAFLADGEWVAQPIGLAAPGRAARPARVRTTFTLARRPRRALLLWTALGVAEPEVNGRSVADDVLSPGWTSYRDRLVHETVDVTALVEEGENVVGATLAGAWYTERYGFFAHAHRVYGDQPAFLAQLRIEHADGSVETVAATDASWSATDDLPVVDSGIYAGEHQDLSRGDRAWSRPGASPDGWSPVRVGAAARPGYETVPVPEARIAPPVGRVGVVPVARVLTTPAGARVLDFGQNLVGRVRLRVRGPAGTRVVVRHAEVLEHGELALRPLRNAAATATFDLAGTGEETLESRFTFYGFRYAQVDGWPGELDPAAIEAVVLSSALTRTGWFSSSEPLLDRLHENVVWGMRGNFVSIPTDCPQRDERLGWTGDIQVFTPTASFLFDCDAFLASWLRDLSAEQARRRGDVPVVIPAVLDGFGSFGVSPAIWGDAATVVPDVLHRRFGDRGVLASQYASMRAWVDRVLAEVGSSGLWLEGMQLGDWLDPSAPPDQPGKAKVSGDLVASAALARSLRIVADAASVLGHDDDAAAYARLADRARTAFLAEFVTPAGRMVDDAPTAYALALQYDLVPDPALRAALGARLAVVVREGGYRIATGFAGTPLVADALADTGHLDAAERLLLQTECPSWLYPVTMGATTVWERWDSMLPDGSVNPGEMTSFNHYALGAVADWLHRTVAGLAPAAPGYRRLRVAPRPLDALDHASARHLTPYGEAEVAWRREGHEIVVTATVPAGTTAEIDLPGIAAEVGSGRHEWRYPAAPAPARGELGLESSLAEVVDSAAGYRALLDAVAAHDPDRAEAVRTKTPWRAGRTVRSALPFAPPQLLADVDAALRAATA